MTEKVEDSLLTELKNITLATFIKENFNNNPNDFR